MTFSELIEHAKQSVQTHPDLKDQIVDIISLASLEIEQGGSEAHEVELAWDEIQSLIDGDDHDR